MNGKRQKIGILFQHNEQWIGGTYYILNLIAALNTLPDNEQPQIFLYTPTAKDFEYVKKQTGYVHLHYRDPKPYFSNPVLRGVNKVSRLLFKKNLIPKRAAKDLAFCFPNPSGNFFKNVKRKIYWIPDLQEKHYPSFFSGKEIEMREKFQKDIASNKEEVVFSSEASKNDFYRFFPDAQVKSHVIKFAVTHPPFGHISFEDVQKKFKLPARYFICPNQFWVHKNHKVVIDALVLLRKEGIDAAVVFTGKEHDHRSPGYTESLKKLANDSGYSDAFLFLGFIDRAEQLAVIKNAVALIQPSLSEGWSTVIEDAMALEKWVVCSAIPANQEQLEKNVSFFDPQNPEQLAGILKESLTGPVSLSKENYQQRVQQFAVDFIKLI